jgi:hypothetical protein
LNATKEPPKEPVAEVDFQSPLYSTPVVANGVMYVSTDKWLYALKK